MLLGTLRSTAAHHAVEDPNTQDHTRRLLGDCTVSNVCLFSLFFQRPSPLWSPLSGFSQVFPTIFPFLLIHL